MKDPLKDPLRRALSNLPRHRAGEAFTERLNKRLDKAPIRRWEPGAATAWPVAATFALAALLAIAAGAALLLFPGQETPLKTASVTEAPPRGSQLLETQLQRTQMKTTQLQRTQIQEMLLQYERLHHDLKKLRGLVEEAEPVIYLGGEDHLGILLPRHAPPGALPTPVRVLPAAYGDPNRL